MTLPHHYSYQDEANGSWWLEVGNELTAVGFWPKVIFSGLGDLANYVEWVSVLNEYGKIVNVDNAEEFADNKDLYEVRDLGYKGDYFGRIIPIWGS
ncbi:hypothetical protein Vadar_026981 [Vaccinium darrowii]|uniref:Uncharacterized protein n=1 Tax=Vaccinium darrowii TaxID=229202 RepID=A0ACB7XK80_9ERIC|nr:hypothetical protein Vadar_026981 [Vaccinium darrowii]